jgi:tRNA G37 N-methylase Trm5
MAKKKGPAARIGKKNAEAARKKLVGMGLMDKMRFPMQRGEYVYLPVVGGAEAEKKITDSGLEIAEVMLEAREVRKNFRQNLIELLSRLTLFN